MQSKLKRRLGYYLTGVVIGLVGLYFFSTSRGCSGFLPTNQVKEKINTRYIYSGTGPACQLKCNAVSPEDLQEFVRKADVNFSKSVTDEDFRQYHLSGKIDGKKVVMRFGYREMLKGTHTYDSTGKLLEIDGLDGTCGCGLTGGPYWVNPDELKLHKLLQGEGLGISKKAKCQIECLGLSKEDLQDVFEQRQVDWASSSPLSDEASFLMYSQDLKVKIELMEGRPVISNVSGQVLCPECDSY